MRQFRTHLLRPHSCRAVIVSGLRCYSLAVAQNSRAAERIYRKPVTIRQSGRIHLGPGPCPGRGAAAPPRSIRKSAGQRGGHRPTTAGSSTANLGEVFRRVTMQLFVRDPFTMIAAPVQGDVDGISKRSHHARLQPMVLIAGYDRRLWSPRFAPNGNRNLLLECGCYNPH